MLSTLLAILLTWMVSSFTFLGIGLGVTRLVGRFNFRPSHLVVLFWMGWGGVIVVLQIWHLFLPVNLAATVFVGLLGVAGLAMNGRALLELITLRRPVLDGLTVTVLLMLAVWLANRCLAAPMNADTGLYHLSAVRWNASYRIVPGIVNLQRVLAYNSSYFLYVGLFEFGVWWGKSHYLANGILLFWTFSPLVSCVIKLFFDRSASPLGGLFAVVLFSPLFFQAVGFNLTSPSPDFAVFILQIITGYWLVTLVLCKGESASESTLLSIAIALLVMVAITIKLSFLGFGAGLILALLAVQFWRQALHERMLPRVAGFLAVGAFLTVGVWMVRGVILSGYPAYPVPFGGVSVEWAATHDEVLDQYNMLRAWGWVPNVHWNRVLGNWEWFAPWLKHLASRRQAAVIPFALVVIASVILLLRRIFRQRFVCENGLPWACLLPPVVGTFYWLLTAPDVRWSGACFWILAAAFLMLALAGMSRLLIVLCGSVFLLNAACVLAIHLLSLKPLWLPGHGDEFFYPTRTVLVKSFVTDSGLILHVPHTGFRCWGAPLPCTPEPRRNLRLRRPRDLQSGFVIDR